VLVALANEPPFVLDHVIVRPAVFTELFDPSSSCAAMVTVLPSVTLFALEVTRYFAAAPAVIVSLAGLPEMFVPPIFAEMFTVVGAPGAVKVAVHTPLVQLTVPSEPASTASVTTLGVALVTTLPFASFTVTVIVAVPLTATELGEIASVEVAALTAPNVVVMFDVVPLSEPSVALTVCTVAATVLVVNVTVACPAASVVDVGAEKLPPFVLDHVTVLPLVAIAEPLASASCAVIVAVLPATTELALDVTTYFAAVGAGTLIAIVFGLPEMLEPPIFAVSDAVPAPAGAVYVAVQTPFVQPTVPSVPRSTVVTTSAGVADVMMFPFASFTVIVTVVVPFVSSDVEPTTRVLVAAFGAPSVVVMLPLVPVRLEASVAVTVCTVPATVLVVNTTVAFPLASVFDVAVAKLPPLVLDQVTTRPEVATGLFPASINCDVIVTVPPSVTELALDVTRYLAAAPALTMTATGLPLTLALPSFAEMFAVAGAPGAVKVAVHTPFVQLTVPSVPASVASVIALGAAFVTTFPFASFTVIVTVVVPFTPTDVEPTDTVVVVALAAPNVVTMPALVPVRADASIALTVCVTLAVVLVANVTVA